MPSKLEKMLKKALRRKPEQRYATAAEFRSDLLDLAQKFKWRFGNVEMSSVMHGVFDAERRRKRNHSWSGEMVPASATPAALGSAPRFPARSGQGQDEVMNLGDQDLEDWGPPSRLPGPLDELPTTNLDDEKTQAIPDDEETRAFRIPAAAPAPGPAAAPRATPAPVPVSNHEPTRRVSAGAFSRNEGLPPPVKKPQRSFMNAHQGTRPAADPAQAATAHAARPAHEAPYQPPVRGAGSGLRTLAGTLLVLALGGALVFWLYTENPAFLGLGPPGKPIPSAAPAPSKLDTGSSKVSPKPKRAAAVSGKDLLHIRSNPTGARIYYCGKATGKVTPARLRIKPGAAPCTIKLTLKGHEPYSMPAPDHSPRPITLVATLRPRGRTFQPSPSPAPTAPAPAKPSRGKLRVTSIQPGSVIINGQQVGQTPRLELKLRPGTYHVTVQFPSLGKTSPRRVVKIKAGKTSSVHVESE